MSYPVVLLFFCRHALVFLNFHSALLLFFFRPPPSPVCSLTYPTAVVRPLFFSLFYSLLRSPRDCRGADPALTGSLDEAVQAAGSNKRRGHLHRRLFDGLILAVVHFCAVRRRRPERLRRTFASLIPSTFHSFGAGGPSPRASAPPRGAPLSLAVGKGAVCASATLAAPAPTPRGAAGMEAAAPDGVTALGVGLGRPAGAACSPAWTGCRGWDSARPCPPLPSP